MLHCTRCSLDALVYVPSSTGPEEAEQLAAEFYTAATALATTGAVECAGIGAALAALQDRGLKQAVVSNSLREFVVACLTATGERTLCLPSSLAALHLGG